MNQGRNELSGLAGTLQEQYPPRGLIQPLHIAPPGDCFLRAELLAERQATDHESCKLKGSEGDPIFRTVFKTEDRRYEEIVEARRGGDGNQCRLPEASVHRREDYRNQIEKSSESKALIEVKSYPGAEDHSGKAKSAWQRGTKGFAQAASQLQPKKVGRCRRGAQILKRKNEAFVKSHKGPYSSSLP